MRRIKHQAFVFLFLIMHPLHIVYAKEFGKYGHTFEVKEEGFLSMIQRKLKLLDIDKEQKKMISLAKKRVEESEAVKGIMPATEDKEYTFDPTYYVDENIKLPNGQILYPAGTRVNPLEKMEFDRKLYFIDGRREEQVSWLKAELAKKNLSKTKAGQPIKEDRVILVGGKPLQLAEELKKEVYFDQFGELTSKFKIKYVPATVEQEEKHLKIKEIAVN